MGSNNRLDAWLALTGQIPAPPDPVELPLLTGSMCPAIPVEALLKIDVASARTCHAGDVVVFLDNQEEHRLVAHRVLLVLRAGPWRWLLEKGDANHHAKWRHETSVKGRVIGFTVAGQPPYLDPCDPVTASSGLRQLIRRWLSSLGGLRTTKPKS